MSRIIVLAVLAMAWGQLHAIDSSSTIQDPEIREQYETLIREVRCLVCQNQTIADSTAPLAADLRVEIREQFEAGASEAEIKQFLLDRYGDFILYRPQLTGSTSVLWAAPVLLMIVGLAVAIGVVRRRRNLPADLDLDGEPDQEEWN